MIASQKLLQLYFIRHGETAWSLSGQHTGRTDIPLTAHGEDEARGLEPCLRAIEFARVLTSPLQRARRTCELAGLGSSAGIEPDLAEWDYGDYEGQLSANFCKERPDWNLFRDGCPGGETPATGGRPRRPADREASSAGRQRRALLASPIRMRPRGAMDRIDGGGRAALCAGAGLAQHSRPRSQPPQDACHSSVEYRPGIARRPMKQRPKS